MHSKDREGPTKSEVGGSFGNRILRTGTGQSSRPDRSSDQRRGVSTRSSRVTIFLKWRATPMA